MTKLETTIKTVLQQLKPHLADSTFESRQRYFSQMLRFADLHHITEPCQELYDGFIADGHSSHERHSMHVSCARLIDACAATKAKDANGILFNEPPLPSKNKTLKYFQNTQYPIGKETCIDYLIVKAGIEMEPLKLSQSTKGQYQHAWMVIRRYFYDAGHTNYDESIIQKLLFEINSKREHGTMNEWKWKINRKASHVLMEVANTGCFQWGMLNNRIDSEDVEMKAIRWQYLESLRERNLTKSTVSLHDYVFRNAMEAAIIKTPKELQALTPEKVQGMIIVLADKCNRRSMATILPILRGILTFLHSAKLVHNNLSGIVMSGFIQRKSNASYISEKDETKLVEQLNDESRRTKAMILLALRLGLRDSDLCKLTFQDIDWQRDKIRLKQKKTGEPLVLPLLPEVGNALMDYILNERPRRDDQYPYIFLRKQAPYQKLSAAYHFCSNLIDRVDIKPENGTASGIHLLRYTLVHKLLKAKVPHQVITNTLGHVSKESAKPYLSMEESMLRMCALDLSDIGKISWQGRTSHA